MIDDSAESARVRKVKKKNYNKKKGVSTNHVRRNRHNVQEFKIYILTIQQKPLFDK